MGGLTLAFRIVPWTTAYDAFDNCAEIILTGKAKLVGSFLYAGSALKHGDGCIDLHAVEIVDHAKACVTGECFFETDLAHVAKLRNVCHGQVFINIMFQRFDDGCIVSGGGRPFRRLSCMQCDGVEYKLLQRL